MEKLSVLIIEDNPADLLLTKEYLSEKQDMNYDIKEAKTLEAATGILSQHDFDIILLDLFLTDSAGLNTVRKVISLSPDTPVIILTGLQDEEIACKAVRYGAQDFLEKQFLSPVLLYKSILYAIERKKILHEKEDLLHDFTKALQMIEKLEGILPVCVSCRKIFDEEQTWLRLEDYIKQNAATEVVRLVCPSCMNELEQEKQG